MPKADYSEIRRTLPVRHSAAHVTLLDPRLRRLIDPHDELLPPPTTTPSIQQIFSIKSPTQLPYEEGTTDAFVVSTQKASLVDTSKPQPTPSSLPNAPRSDPRRKQQDTTAQPSPPASQHMASSPNNVSSAHQLDTKAIHSSEWYKDLSSKLKIMVNQQMAIVAAELRKFHNDTSANKVFDLTFVRQNQLLQQVLTQLGTYIDENGHFVKVDVPPIASDSSQHRQMFEDFGAPPPQHQMDFVRPPPSMQQQQHRPNNLHSEAPGGVPFGMRPGLLGLAPPVRSTGGGGNDFNGQYENSTNGGGGFDNNNGGGYTNPFNPMFSGRPPAPQHQQQQQQSGGSQFSRGGNNHRWGNQNRNANNNRHPRD